MPKIPTVVAARWKTFMPLAVYGISEALKHNTELNTPSGKLAFVSAVFAAIAVHQVPNKQTTVAVDPAAPVKDVGQVGISLLLMILAIVCLAIFALIAHGTVNSDEGFTWLGVGLVFWALAEVVP